MFSKLFIKIKNMMINHAILSLCLGGVIASEILTGFAYFVPDVAKIISYVWIGIAVVNVLITLLLVVIYIYKQDNNTKKVQRENTILIFMIVSTLMLLLSFVIPTALVMFKG